MTNPADHLNPGFCFLVREPQCNVASNDPISIYSKMLNYEVEHSGATFPIDNNQTASGKVTVIEAMRYGRPVIATDCIGTSKMVLMGSCKGQVCGCLRTAVE
jgi:glycosyltransferase involved in cell wall biosynthesis